LFMNGWIILSSVSMYIGLNLLIKKEEDMLEKAFGQQYLDYKKTVGRLILKL
jgi:protein-S-isoprenylcysteine O-methyltransferase Ste14